MLKTLTAAIGGTTLAALLGWFGPTVLADHSADWPESTALADAQRAARAAYLKEKSDARQCTHLHGPGAAMRYTADGDLVCSTKRGGGAVVVAAGGAL